MVQLHNWHGGNDRSASRCRSDSMLDAMAAAAMPVRPAAPAADRAAPIDDPPKRFDVLVLTWPRSRNFCCRSSSACSALYPGSSSGRPWMMATSRASAPASSSSSSGTTSYPLPDGSISVCSSTSSDARPGAASGGTTPYPANAAASAGPTTSYSANALPLEPALASGAASAANLGSSAVVAVMPNLRTDRCRSRCDATSSRTLDASSYWADVS
mmetsp:Transcript_11154/g.35424  ORF Transcript_11154/g.35424 Transcript_11154/m.35424 type:complete len:214 (+) Transcript_11154:1574-2215(+)